MQREGKATGGGRVMGVRCRAGARLTVSRRFARREGRVIMSRPYP